MNRRIPVLLATLVICALVASPALAAPPVMVTDMPVDQTMPLTTCDGFAVNFHALGTATFTQFLDKDGQVVRAHEHVLATVTFYNVTKGEEFGVTGTSVFNNHIDLVNGQTSQTGLLFSVHVPGLGPVLMETGRTVIQWAPTFYVVSTAGQHPWWLAEPMPELCALLD